MSNRTFHKDFKLNGNSFSSSEKLLVYAKSLSSSVLSFLTDWFSSDNFVVVQTSGSTGTPKPIQLKKEFMRNSAFATSRFFNLPAQTTAFLCLSTDYIAGKMMLVRALTLGWSLDIVAPTSEVLITKKYDFSAMVPMQLRNSISEINKIKKLIVGGGVVANDLLEQIQQLKTKVFATYGMTETCTHVAVKKLNHIKTTPNFYKTLPNVTIYRDQRNCLVIEAHEVSNEIITTNDVVQLISEKQFDWLGRFDNVINSGGVKLHPEKIEEKLATSINQRFFVAGIEDNVLGEKLILVVEGKKTHINLSNVKNLTKYETPKEIFFLDKFIETDTKKIQRIKTLSNVVLI